MINAESLALLRAGSMLYGEKLSGEVKSLQDELKDVLAEVAVEIDYPEEDADGIDLKRTADKISLLSERVDRLISTYKCGKKIKHGVTVAICGKPNTGKSSLLNAMLGYDKAIVSSEEGTTRDAVEGSMDIDGVKYNLVDTAGIRLNAGAVESIGIERAKAVMYGADIVLSVSEGEDFELPDDISGEVIKVFNKSDEKSPQKNTIYVFRQKRAKTLKILKD